MRTCSKCKRSDLTDADFFKDTTIKGKTFKRGTCKACQKASHETFVIDITEVPPIPGEPPTAPMPPPVHESYSGNIACAAPGWVSPVPAALDRVLFVPDVHRPYHDKAAWSLFLRAAAGFKPDKIVVLGDFADFYSVSSFDKHPRRVSDLKTEAEDANVGLDELDALGASYKVFIKGNHEDRLERYLCKSAPALFGCVNVNDLFHLGQRGWNVVEYKRSTRLGKLRLTHDTGTAGINAHRQSVDAFQGSCAIGHTHRMEMSFRGNSDGNPTVGAMFGWLGDFDQIDYLQAVRAKRDWVHGFGVGFHEPSTGMVHIQPVPIVKGSCCVAGVLYR